MMNMLMHDDFFTLADGHVKSFWKMGKFKGRFIILHPFLHFGSMPHFPTEEQEEDAKIYFEKYEINARKDPFDIDEFMSGVEKGCYLKKDEVLWYETGFWTAVLGSQFVMGAGTTRLQELLERTKLCFAICLQSNISLTIINSDVNDCHKITVSVYASNDISPYVEVLEPFRKEIDRHEGSRRVASKVLLEKEIRRFWKTDRKILLRPLASAMHLEDKDLKVLPIIRSPFRRVRDPIVNNLCYLTGITSGGFLDSDFEGKRRFLPYAEIWELSTASVVEFVFQ